MITCAIIENNPLDGESLCNLIKTDFYNELTLIGSTSSAKEGMDIIMQNSPELVFLDIDLANNNGVLLFTCFFNNSIDVIFTTSKLEDALSAFRQSTIGYLCKPFNLIDIRSVLTRLKKKKSEQKTVDETVKQLTTNLKMGTSYQEKIALPTYDGFQVIHFNEILYCQASENYAYIYTLDGNSFLITKTLKSIEELLPTASFFRIHKSILLNINYVKSFSRKDGFMATLENGQKFEIATRRQEEFTNLFFRKNSETKAQNENVTFSGETLN